MEISRDTFSGSDNSTQNLILFDSIKGLCDKIDARTIAHDEKHEKIDGAIVASGKVNRRVSAGSGLLSGFVAVIGAKFLGL